MITNEDCIKDYVLKKIEDHIMTCYFFDTSAITHVRFRSLRFATCCYACHRFNRWYNRGFLRFLVSPDPNESCCTYRSHDASSKAAALPLLPCLYRSYTSKVDRATDKNID